MEDQNVINQFRRSKMWHSKGICAPHKPLLMMLSLSAFMVSPEFWKLLLD